jgi:hypothetical protein
VSRKAGRTEGQWADVGELEGQKVGKPVSRKAGCVYHSFGDGGKSEGWKTGSPENQRVRKPESRRAGIFLLVLSLEAL